MVSIRKRCFSATAFAVAMSLAAAVSLAAALLVEPASAQMLPLPLHSTATAPTVSKLPAWDVVSLKEHKAGDNNMQWRQTPDGVQFTNLTLLMLLQQAYELYNANDDRVLGLPAWGKSMHFDLTAKVSAEDAPTLKQLTAGQRAAMLRAALEDRFVLHAHIITTDLPVYALVVGKGGSRLKTSAPAQPGTEGKPAPEGTWRTGDGSIEATANTLEVLVSKLTESTGRTVIDRTGLTGRYDYKLEWTPETEADASSSDNGKAGAPPLFTAIQEQLGLRLEPARGPVIGLVVDSVALPAAN